MLPEPIFNITAWHRTERKRLHLFTWTRDAYSGIQRALREAKEFGMADLLSDYQAERITEKDYDT